MTEPLHPDSVNITAAVDDYIERMAAITMAQEGTTVRFHCLDERQAADLLDSVSLLLADRIASWRKVVRNMPSHQEWMKWWAEIFSSHPDPAAG